MQPMDAFACGCRIALFIGKVWKRLMQRGLACIFLATLVAISCGCGGAIKQTQKVEPAQRGVALDATKEDLLDKYNAIAKGVKSLNMTVELKPTAGSKYSGVIEDYHEVKAFLLAERPAYVRMIGQAPVIGKTVFDMTSDTDTFRVSIPSKNKFLIGPISMDRNSKNPIENLRPQHLLDALLWSEIRKEEEVLFEEFNDEQARYYILTVLRGGREREILRKIWFDRANLQIVRLQEFGPKGVLLSDVRFSDWRPLIADQEGTPLSFTSFPFAIQIDRPHDDYHLNLQVTKLMLNEDIPADRFKLEQPAGSELVRVGDEAEKKQP
jgi:hypothetical protein